jgi:rhodanese-related sulfurtransferase
MSISVISRFSLSLMSCCALLASAPAFAQTATPQKATATAGGIASTTSAVGNTVTRKAAVLSVPEAYERAQQSGVTLVDVREPQEWTGGVASNAKGEVLAKLLPMSKLSERVQEIPNDPNQAIILICRTQNRSAEVAKQLIAKGYTNVSYVNGGMKEWGERQLPTAAPPK